VCLYKANENPKQTLDTKYKANTQNITEENDRTKPKQNKHVTQTCSDFNLVYVLEND